MQSNELNHKNELKHRLTLDARNKLAISGVEDVDSFDEQTVELFTTLGGLTIKGEGLRINQLNVDNGELLIEGEVDSIVYDKNETKEKGGGFFFKMFR